MNIRTIALATSALITMSGYAFAAQQPIDPQKVYDTVADIKCGSDQQCQGTPNIQINNLTVSGITGNAIAKWSMSSGVTTSCPGTVDGVKYINPPGHTGIGCYVVVPTVANSIAGRVAFQDFGGNCNTVLNNSGVVTDPGFDNTAAIQAAVNYAAYHGAATVYNAQAGKTCRIADTVYMSSNTGAAAYAASVTLDMAGSVRKYQWCDLYNSNTSGHAALKFGNPSEAPGSHLNYAGVRNATICGNPLSGVGLWSYDVALYVENVDMFANGGVGQYMNISWGSYFRNVFWHNNNSGGDQFVSVTSLNSVIFDNLHAISATSGCGMRIYGGSYGSYSIVLNTPDFENNQSSLCLDTSTGTISSIVINAGNWEADHGYMINGSGAGKLDGIVINGGKAGSGLNNDTFYLDNPVSGLVVNGLEVSDSSINILNCLSGVIINPIMSGTSIGTITGCPVQYATSGGAPGTFKTGDIWQNGAGQLYMGFGTSWVGLFDYANISNITGNPSTHVAPGAMDALTYRLWTFVISDATSTSALITINGTTNLISGTKIVVQIGNDGGSSTASAVTFTGVTVKTTAAVLFPTQYKKTSITFQKDSNGIWEEIARATNAG